MNLSVSAIGNIYSKNINCLSKRNVSALYRNKDCSFKGVNYDEIDTLDLSRTRTISQMSKDKKEGMDISQDREKLILSRVKKAQNDARIFVEDNPQFNYDDICQDLILMVVELTDANLDKDNENNSFGPNYANKRNGYFSNLLKQEKIDEEINAKLASIIEENPTEDKVFNNELKRTIVDVLATMPQKDKKVITLRFGLADGVTRSLSETGRDLNRSIERIRQIECKAIRRLRHPRRKDLLNPFSD